VDDRLAQMLLRAGLRGWHLRSFALGSVWLCLSLWLRAKTVDQQERGNAERRAIFVGLWPPTLYMIGETLDRQALRGPRRAWRRGPFA
jgi:hypothetical protein